MQWPDQYRVMQAVVVTAQKRREDLPRRADLRAGLGRTLSRRNGIDSIQQPGQVVDIDCNDTDDADQDIRAGVINPDRFARCISRVVDRVGIGKLARLLDYG